MVVGPAESHRPRAKKRVAVGPDSVMIEHPTIASIVAVETETTHANHRDLRADQHGGSVMRGRKTQGRSSKTP